MVFSSGGFGKLLTRKARNELFESRNSSQTYYTSLSSSSSQSQHDIQMKSKTKEFPYGDFISIQKEETIVEL